ncbi:hypothetical protein CVS40_9986 [Lucilia cuprina]|nr:hypothetical protein CVS40_9986 [Lucilia cuprina]
MKFFIGYLILLLSLFFCVMGNPPKKLKPPCAGNILQCAIDSIESLIN